MIDYNESRKKTDKYNSKVFIVETKFTITHLL